MAKVTEFTRQVNAERKKVTWPTVKETRAMTLMVFLMVVMASIFFLIVDSFLGWGTTWLLGL
jgi:preprotein translocase subunit SecE